MSIGSRIRFIRLKRGYTQKELGLKVGFSENSADVRIAHYEMDLKKPRDTMLEHIAKELGVEIDALNPNTKTTTGLVHQLFALEDETGFCMSLKDGKLTVSFDNTVETNSALLLQRAVTEWAVRSDALRNGQITQEEYDTWRYTFGKVDTSSNFSDAEQVTPLK